MARFLFVVQGEGRGHMTQALSLQHMLMAQQHDVVAILIGSSTRREVPDFIKKNAAAPLHTFQSPNFVTDKKGKSIRILPTVFQTISRLGIYKKSTRMLRQWIQEYQPDVIVNFFDPLVGLLYASKHPGIPMVCIGHQFLFLHPAFQYPSGFIIDRIAIRLYTRLTCIGASRKLALSFYPLDHAVEQNVFVVPPLLRKEVAQQEIKKEDYLLIYLLNSGYIEDIVEWHAKHPTVTIHCFTDKKGRSETEQINERLTLHPLDDKKFLRMMAAAKGLVTTAGFESVCEALYFGKPVFMVPVQGHYEQYCNSRDAVKAGAGIFSDRFNIDLFLSYLPKHNTNPQLFRQWADNASARIISHIEDLPTFTKAAFVVN